MILFFCLKSAKLQFDGKHYRQIHGTSMGSPVSVVVANHVMEELEKNAMSSFVHNAPKVFKRYIDDTVCVIKKSSIDIFSSTSQ